MAPQTNKVGSPSVPKITSNKGTLGTTQSLDLTQQNQASQFAKALQNQTNSGKQQTQTPVMIAPPRLAMGTAVSATATPAHPRTFNDFGLSDAIKGKSGFASKALVSFARKNPYLLVLTLRGDTPDRRTLGQKNQPLADTYQKAMKAKNYPAAAGALGELVRRYSDSTDRFKWGFNRTHATKVTIAKPDTNGKTYTAKTADGTTFRITPTDDASKPHIEVFPADPDAGKPTILITPIMDPKGTLISGLPPVPKDWKSNILVTPVDSGVPPLHIIHTPAKPVEMPNIVFSKATETKAGKRVAGRIDDIKGKMSAEEDKRTTYAVAEVKTKNGKTETWIASAGVRGYVRPDLKNKGDKVINNLHPKGQPGNHLNDAEGKLMREAKKRGATIKALGATKPMCNTCQRSARARGLTETVVTPFKK